MKRLDRRRRYKIATDDRMQTLAAILDEGLLQNARSGAVLDEVLTSKVTSAL